MIKAKILRQNIQVRPLRYEDERLGQKLATLLSVPYRNSDCLQNPHVAGHQVNELPRVNGTVHVHLKLMCTSAPTWGIQGHFGEGMERTMSALP